MDPITLVVGAGIALGCLLVGHVTGRVAGPHRRPAPPPEVKPVCGCRHHRAHHNLESGECNELVEYQLRDGSNYLAGTEWRQCTCQQYVGPVPIETLWQPPVLPEGSDR